MTEENSKEDLVEELAIEELDSDQLNELEGGGQIRSWAKRTTKCKNDPELERTSNACTRNQSTK